MENNSISQVAQQWRAYSRQQFIAAANETDEVLRQGKEREALIYYDCAHVLTDKVLPAIEAMLGRAGLGEDTTGSIGPGERKTWLKIIYLLTLAVKNGYAICEGGDGELKCSGLETLLKSLARESRWASANGTTPPEHGLSAKTLRRILHEARNLVSPH